MIASQLETNEQTCVFIFYSFSLFVSSKTRFHFEFKYIENRPRFMYLKIQTWLRGFLIFQFTIFGLVFFVCSSLFFELRDNGVVLKFCPWSSGVMLEFQYLEHGAWL